MNSVSRNLATREERERGFIIIENLKTRGAHRGEGKASLGENGSWKSCPHFALEINSSFKATAMFKRIILNFILQ